MRVAFLLLTALGLTVLVSGCSAGAHGSSQLGASDQGNQVESDVTDATMAALSYESDHGSLKGVTASKLTDYGFTPKSVDRDWKFKYSSAERFCVQASDPAGDIYKFDWLGLSGGESSTGACVKGVDYD